MTTRAQWIEPEVRTSFGAVRDLARHHLGNPDLIAGTIHVWHDYLGRRVVRPFVDGGYINSDYSGRSIIVAPEAGYL